MEETAALASYVPSYVRRRVADGLPPLPAVDLLSGAVLFADISGFTAISERMADQGPGGAEAVTVALNRYFGRLIEIITEHGGEVLSFAGDALLACWPGDPDEASLVEAVARATQCGVALSGVHRQAVDADASSLTVRLAVSAGDLRALHLGGVDAKRFSVVTGPPLARAFAVSERLAPGAVGLDDHARRLIGDWADSVERVAGCHVVQSVRSPVGPRSSGAGDVPFRGSMNDLSPYIPLSVVSRERLGQSEWLAELRRVTVIFINLPDLVRADLDAAQQVVCTLQTELSRHEATINKLSVDGHGTSLVAATGLPPLSHEDDPARAVRAALAASDALRRLGWQGALGVATGRVFCGPIGNPIRREYTMVGDVVNVAARLMQLALADGVPGEVAVLCDSSTQRASGRRVEYGAGTEVAVKGKANRLVAYRPLRRHAPVGPEGIQILGRDRERRALTAAFDALVIGEPPVLVFEGEAGIGKSRLLREARMLAKERGVRSISGAGDVIERAVAYHAWRPAVAALLRIDEGLGGTVAAERALATMTEDLRTLAPLLNLVFGLALPDTEETAKLQGESRVEATRDLLLTILQRAAVAEPLLVVIDDLQWVDSASWSLILEAIRRVPGLLLVVATRPREAGSAWPEYPELLAEARTQALSLGPLEASASVELVCNRLGVSSLPDPVVQLILDKAAGNPLFSEELGYALRDAEVITVTDGRCVLSRPGDLSSFGVPDTVHGFIASRIDTLDPRAQLALKVASVIGRTFLGEMVQDVYPIEADRRQLPRSFDTLVRRSFAVPQEPEPHRIFAFRHILTRDVAYNLMLSAQRRELHGAIAHWYEARFGDNLAPLYAMLGHHWSRAEVFDKAAHYLELASIQALNSGAVREAVDLGLEAASMLGVDLPRSPAEVRLAIDRTLAAIEERMTGQSVDELLSLPAVKDPAIASVMGILLRTEPPAFMSHQLDLFALMGLQNFLLTLEHGSTPFTAGVVAIYAMVVHALSGDSGRAFALGQLAKELAARDAPEMASYAGFVHSWFLHHWIEPIGTTLGDLLEHSRLGFEHGDVTFACFNAAAYPVHLAWSGAPVDEVIEAASASRQVIAGQVDSAAFHCLQEIQMAKALAGRTLNPCSLTDQEGQDGVDEEWDLASICETQSYNQAAYYLVAKLRLHYYYREYEAALAFADRAQRLLPCFAGQAIQAEFALFQALALLGRPPSGRVGTPDVEQARAILTQVQGWAQQAPAIFRHKSLLIEGELLRVEGATTQAAAVLEEAAESAEAIGFVHHAALARELEARSRLEGGDVAGGRSALEQARQGYERWGAGAKVDDIARRLGRIAR